MRIVGRRVAGASGLWMAEVGAVVVQICHKGRCAVRVAEMKPRDSAVLSAAHRDVMSQDMGDGSVSGHR